MALLFIAIIAALLAVGLRKVPPNTQWLPILWGRRLPFRITEGWTWLPWGLFTYIPVDTREDRLDILVKPKQYERPDDYAPSNDEPYQVEESILAPDGEGEGAAYVHVSNVSAQFHITKAEPGVLPWWMKPLGFFGWKPGSLLLAYTSIDSKDIKQRLETNTLRNLRLIIGNIPYQLTTNVPLRINGVLPNPQERLTVRRQIDTDLLSAVNSEVNPWGVTVTAILIGDIDPDKTIMDSLQAISAARFQKEQVLIAMSASVEQIKLFAAAANEPLSWQRVLEGYAAIAGQQNLGKAAEHGLMSATWLQNLKGLISANVNVTNAIPPTAPPAPPTAPLTTADPVAA